MANSVVKELVKVKVKSKDGEETIKEVPITEVTLISGGYEGTVNEDEIKIEIDNEEIDANVMKELFKEN